MIYKDEKLVKRDCEYLFDEQHEIDECSNKINEIFGNHRDENNVFIKNLLELEKNKLIKQALRDIVKIKTNLYFESGVKLWDPARVVIGMIGFVY